MDKIPNQNKEGQEEGTQQIDFLGDDDLDGEEEFEYTNTGGQNKEDDEFDEIVGTLQDLVLDPQFEEMQSEFLGKNCTIFDDEEENKIEYMQIFQEYQDKLENYIEKKLKEAKPDLNMKKFILLVESRLDEIDPQLQDMLLSFTDFQLFKEHMLAHKKLQLSIKKKSKKFEEFKQEKDKLTALEQDLGDLVISGQSKVIHVEKKKAKEEVKPVKKENVVSKENKGKDKSTKPEKEGEAEDLAKYTHKKATSKANADYKPSQKGNIFS